MYRKAFLWPAFIFSLVLAGAAVMKFFLWDIAWLEADEHTRYQWEKALNPSDYPSSTEWIITIFFFVVLLVCAVSFFIKLRRVYAHD